MKDENIKAYTAEICRICESLYPDEWPGKYTGLQSDFKDWLNEKTGLIRDHRVYENREAALKAWMDKLLEIESEA